MNKPEYLFPRLGIVDLRKVCNFQTLFNNLELYHGKYYNIFNLTNITLDNRVHSIKFKWRGAPFSITQTIKVLYNLDQYFKSASGNVIIFCTNTSDAYLFTKIMIRQYINICILGLTGQQKNKQICSKLQSVMKKISPEHPYFSQNLISLYQLKSVYLPPVKMISCFQLSRNVTFIPILEIYHQVRYNEFQLIYTHNIENGLAQYYFDLKKPLELTKSIGDKYYDKKPETIHLAQPVVVCGDVKIVCYSFNTMERKKEFTVGFNTKKIIFSEEIGENQGVITMTYQDTYQRSTQNDTCSKDINIKKTNFNQELEVYIKVENWCDNIGCSFESKCEHCQQYSKKLNFRYNDIQNELNKFYRQRSVNQVKQYFSLT